MAATISARRSVTGSDAIVAAISGEGRASGRSDEVDGGSAAADSDEREADGDEDGDGDGKADDKALANGWRKAREPLIDETAGTTARRCFAEALVR